MAYSFLSFPPSFCPAEAAQPAEAAKTAHKTYLLQRLLKCIMMLPRRVLEFFGVQNGHLWGQGQGRENTIFCSSVRWRMAGLKVGNSICVVNKSVGYVSTLNLRTGWNLSASCLVENFLQSGCQGQSQSGGARASLGCHNQSAVPGPVRVPGPVWGANARLGCQR